MVLLFKTYLNRSNQMSDKDTGETPDQWIERILSGAQTDSVPPTGDYGIENDPSKVKPRRNARATNIQNRC